MVEKTFIPNKEYLNLKWYHLIEDSPIWNEMLAIEKKSGLLKIACLNKEIRVRYKNTCSFCTINYCNRNKRFTVKTAKSYCTNPKETTGIFQSMPFHLVDDMTVKEEMANIDKIIINKK